MYLLVVHTFNKMIALCKVETEVEAPYGTIPRSSILISKHFNNDMIIGRDLLEKSRVMLNIELHKHGLLLKNIEKVEKVSQAVAAAGPSIP